MASGDIKKVYEVITDKFKIPSYQRPYSWTTKNVQELFDDIENLLDNQKKIEEYRIGTVLLYENKENKDGELEIVDGQQRIVTMSLIYYCLDKNFNNFVIEGKYKNKTTIKNIYYNYKYLKNRISNYKDDYKEKLIKLIKEKITFVVIIVSEISEAFQLFDSQNSRGKELYPHDLLKAYHLREMNECESEILYQVEKWENLDNKQIYDLFNDYLFPIYNWINMEKTHTFTNNDIDIYKGVKKDSNYNYAKKLLKSEPIFQLDEFYVAGKAFFEYVNHYLRLKETVINELNRIVENEFDKKENIKNIIADEDYRLKYAQNLFYAILICYYDRFNILDKNIIQFLYKWSFQIRCDMKSLGFATINNYAIGKDKDYTNEIPMFNFINKSNNHRNIYKLNIAIEYYDDTNKSDWYKKIFKDTEIK